MRFDFRPLPSPDVNSIDIIVPVYRNAGLVKDCVDSLLEHIAEIADRKPRLLLINDSPDDIAVTTLLRGYEHEQAGVQVITNPANLGFVRAVNRGLDIARSERRDVLLVNSDTVTFQGTLSGLLGAVDADPQIAFACPRSNNASICSLPHFHGGRPPTPQEAHARWAAISSTMPDWHFAPTAVGFYMFIAYRVLANHGNLREDFGKGYEEENDLVMQARKVGQRAIIVNRSFAYHAGSASFSLTGIDLDSHRHANHQKLNDLHPEFLPLVRRFQASPHYRAERQLAGVLPDAAGRIRVVVDLSGLGRHHNGTNEHAVAVVRALVARHADRLAVTGLGSAESFAFHGLDRVSGLRRQEPGTPELHAVALRIAQPFDLHHVNVLEDLAPVNVFAMLDTISEDCGPLAADAGFFELWEHVAEHADGLLFNSRFSEQAFCTRYPEAAGLPRMTRLLSTRLKDYRRSHSPTDTAEDHVLILGNHFPHKGAETAARRLAMAYPTLRIVVIGGDVYQRGNVTGLRSGTISPERVAELFLRSSVVVLPSHIEGFGLGFMHALAAGKPIVARRIGPTEEILAVLDEVGGVELFDHDPDLPDAVGRALAAGCSHARDDRAPGWDDWADGVAELCLELVQRNDLFVRLRNRMRAGDRLRRGAAQGTAAAAPRVAGAPVAEPSGVAVDELLQLDGAAFVEAAYNAVLCRPADDGGLNYYVGLVQDGIEKVEILRMLSSSPEGRSKGIVLAGLNVLLAQLDGTSTSGHAAN